MKARVTTLLLHVANGKEVNQNANRRDVYQHHGGKSVDIKTKLKWTLVRRRQIDSLRPEGRHVVKRRQRNEECDDFGGDTDARDFRSHAPAAEADDQPGCERRDQNKNRVGGQEHVKSRLWYC